jgi:hypothetical protein
MRRALLLSICAIPSILTGTAAAEEYLKGTFALSGGGVCLFAPDGFTNDSTGIPAITNGTNSFQVARQFSGRTVYNGDGTGTGTGTFITLSPKGIGSGTFSYSFTYTPIVDSSFEVTVPMDEAPIEHGPMAGQQEKVVGEKTRGQVSGDRHLVVSGQFGVLKYYFGSTQNPVESSCTSSNTEIRLD